ncbi:hypothetical protein ACHAXT_001259 [Thalassiosira profunda]
MGANRAGAREVLLLGCTAEEKHREATEQRREDADRNVVGVDDVRDARRGEVVQKLLAFVELDGVVRHHLLLQPSELLVEIPEVVGVAGQLPLREAGDGVVVGDGQSSRRDAFSRSGSLSEDSSASSITASSSVGASSVGASSLELSVEPSVKPSVKPLALSLLPLPSVTDAPLSLSSFGLRVAGRRESSAVSPSGRLRLLRRWTRDCAFGGSMMKEETSNWRTSCLTLANDSGTT